MSLWRRLTYPFRPGPRRPLATRQPSRADRSVPLGMEAMDLDGLDSATRRNQALEGLGSARSGFRPKRSTSFTEAVDTVVAPFEDDATYAAKYHRAYGKKD